MSETLLDRDSLWPKMPIVRVAANAAGRDWVVGDLHGACDLLEKALGMVDFNTSRDRLFCLGDMIDRGAKSMEVLRLSREPWFYAQRGNHEQACLDLHGEYTVENKRMHPDALNFGGRILGEAWLRKLSDSEQLEVISILVEAPVLFTVESKRGRVGLVHAEVPAQCTWAALEKAVLHMPENLQVCSAALCSRRMPERLASGDSHMMAELPPRVEGVARVYHGHVALRWPFRHENRYYIDTGAWQAGTADSWSALTLVQLDVDSRTFDRRVTRKIKDGIRVIADD